MRRSLQRSQRQKSMVYGVAGVVSRREETVEEQEDQKGFLHVFGGKDRAGVDGGCRRIVVERGGTSAYGGSYCWRL